MLYSEVNCKIDTQELLKFNCIAAQKGKLHQGKTQRGKLHQGKTQQGKLHQGKTQQGKLHQEKTQQRSSPRKSASDAISRASLAAAEICKKNQNQLKF